MRSSIFKNKIAMVLTVFMLFVVGGAVLAACSKKTVNPNVVLITMDKQDEHWNRVNSGASTAKAAAPDDVTVDYDWLAPAQAKDEVAQVGLINSAATNGAKVIILAALNAEGSKSAVEDAMAKGVQFIYVDSPSDAKGAIATFATDNRVAGEKAAQKIKDIIDELNGDDDPSNDMTLSGSTDVYSLRPDSSPSTLARQDGFKAKMESLFPGLTVDITGQKLDTPEKAQDFAKTQITNNAKILFGTNEGTTVAIGQAIHDENAKSDGKYVLGAGFDVSDPITTSINNGDILFTMQQDPNNMGKLSMELAIKLLKDKDYKPENTEVDTGSDYYLGTETAQSSQTQTITFGLFSESDVLPIQNNKIA